MELLAETLDGEEAAPRAEVLQEADATGGSLPPPSAEAEPAPAPVAKEAAPVGSPVKAEETSPDIPILRVNGHAEASALAFADSPSPPPEVPGPPSTTEILLEFEQAHM